MDKMLKPIGYHFSTSSHNDQAQGCTHGHARTHMHTQAHTPKRWGWEIKGHLRSFHYISLATGLEIKDEMTPWGYFWWLCPLLFFTTLTFTVPFFGGFIITLKIAEPQQPSAKADCCHAVWQRRCICKSKYSEWEEIRHPCIWQI